MDAAHGEEHIERVVDDGGDTEASEEGHLVDARCCEGNIAAGRTCEANDVDDDTGEIGRVCSAARSDNTIIKQLHHSPEVYAEGVPVPAILAHIIEVFDSIMAPVNNIVIRNLKGCEIV